MGGVRRMLALATTFLLLTPALAQKDGIISRMPGSPPALAPDGIPATVRITPGTFRMGADAATLPVSITKGFAVMSTRPSHGDFDELPALPVKISKAFAIGITEVTPEEFRQFDPTYMPGPATAAYAAGISWQQAMDYCAWLTKKPANPGVSPLKPSGST